MSDTIYNAIFRVTELLELPVVILALLALAAVLVEVGMFIVELIKRRRRTFSALSKAGASARQAVDAGRTEEASALLQTVAWSTAVGKAFAILVAEVGKPSADTRIAKELADFDFAREGRLSRTRLLVRVGPALGLMGTLIPLTPALDGLARGDVDALTDNLRLAFSVTALGILIGALALGLSLVRERLYGQDFSDLEYVAAILTDDRLDPATAVPSSPATSEQAPTAAPVNPAEHRLDTPPSWPTAPNGPTAPEPPQPANLDEPAEHRLDAPPSWPTPSRTVPEPPHPDDLDEPSEHPLNGPPPWPTAPPSPTAPEPPQPEDLDEPDEYRTDAPPSRPTPPRWDTTL